MCLFSISCNKQAVGEQQRIVFGAQIGPSQASMGVQTKVPTPVTSLSSFYVSATAGPLDDQVPVWNSDIYSWSDTENAYVSTHLWPSPDPSYHFLASNLRIYNEPENTFVNADTDTDVLCAYMASPNYLKKNTLVFKHVLARLGTITIKPGKVFTDVDPAPYYTVTDVTIKVTPWNKGKYDIEKGDGHNDGTGWLAREKADSPVIIAQTAGPIDSEGTAYSQANDLWLVPETYAILLSWTVTHDVWSRTYEDIPAAVPMYAGEINNVIFVLGGDKSLVFELITTPQEVVTRDLSTNTEYNNIWE